MKALRRPEVIALLVLVLAGLGWVAWTRRPEAGTTAAPVSDLTILRAVATPDGTHRRLRIEFSLRHSLPHPLEVKPPQVRLLDSTGAVVPEFFHPGEFPPALPPGASSASWAEFWVSADQATRHLTLEVMGARVEVKPAPGSSD